MPRHFKDWLGAYCDYASFSEAPRRMHFWTGVSTIAGALRRKVWIDMAYFKWTPNFYIVLVAPPGIVSKSTTAAIGMNLLRKVPGINFGPDVVTWPALVTCFSQCNENFQIGEDWYTQCAVTLESSEFGNLINPQDREMVDLLVNLWDSKQGAFKKVTKGSGVDTIENPWINLIACTTPAWIAGNFPEYIIGGGFTSRCLFVYTDEKEKYVAYPHLSVPKNLKDIQEALVQDLEHIAMSLAGGYRLDQGAIAWGTEWYERHYKNVPEPLRDDRFGGYIARKQTHIHKTAIVLAASQRDELVITADDLALANLMVTNLEQDMPKVFSKIGRTDQSLNAERLVNYVKARRSVTYQELYRYCYNAFPDIKEFENIFKGAQGAGLIRLQPVGDKTLVVYTKDLGSGNPLPADNGNPEPAVATASSQS